MRLSLVSWNINSVRLRIEQVERFLKNVDTDLICLQEIKCQTHEFPYENLKALGFEHIHVSGQKGWHGVALASKHPFEIIEASQLCRRGEAREQAIRLGGIDIHNFYIPAGGDLPDREQNDKFDHKFEFYERLIGYIEAREAKKPMLITGDFNIAPGENDVWSHKQMLKVVSHTPQELAIFAKLIEAGQFHDPFRAAFPEPQKLYSWWSYRAADFRASNRGLRLDHVLINPALKGLIKGDISAKVHDDVREWPQPSDHAPVQVVFEI